MSRAGVGIEGDEIRRKKSWKFSIFWVECRESDGLGVKDEAMPQPELDC